MKISISQNIVRLRKHSGMTQMAVDEVIAEQQNKMLSELWECIKQEKA